MKPFNVLATAFCLILLPSFAATPQVKNVKAFQQYPWNKVYITYEVEGDIPANVTKGMVPFLLVTASDKKKGSVYATATSLPSVNVEPYLSGDTGTAAGVHTVVWDIGSQGVAINSANVVFTVMYSDESVYLVVDLSTGANATSYPVSCLENAPSGGWSDEYKTTKLVLRRIPAGTFKMQNIANVTLTKPFYIGVFEVTRKQYELVMGEDPSYFKGNDAHPVHNVSYYRIRGSSNGAKWPSSSAVDSSSFMGKLRARTGLNFDLPTEAQWEYACRAGTTSSYNNGGSTDNDLSLLGRWNSSGLRFGSNNHAVVGSYKPNNWGLYDMHGNVAEWCLDWYGNISAATDPKGASSGADRVFRGGSFYSKSGDCTSGYRDKKDPSNASGFSTYGDNGFRICLTVSE